MIERHRVNDRASDSQVEATLDTKAAARLARLGKEAADLRAWLAANPQDRQGRGKRAGVRLSDRAVRSPVNCLLQPA